jgi:hypothetical protein
VSVSIFCPTLCLATVTLLDDLEAERRHRGAGKINYEKIEANYRLYVDRPTAELPRINAEQTCYYKVAKQVYATQYHVPDSKPGQSDRLDRARELLYYDDETVSERLDPHARVPDLIDLNSPRRPASKSPSRPASKSPSRPANKSPPRPARQSPSRRAGSKPDQRSESSSLSRRPATAQSKDTPSSAVAAFLAKRG